MFDIVEGNSRGLADVEWFVRLLSTPPEALQTFFDADRDIIVTRAPGRLDVMGGIADYSGSLVLEMPIAQATFAAIQQNSNKKIEIISLDHVGNRVFTFDMNIADLLRNGEPLDLASAIDYFAEGRHGEWASYIAGVFFVLGRERGVRFNTGARILVASHVPIGKGLSSSAAVEVSVMQAVCTAFGISLPPRELALLCQTVENHVVGAACGVMDQITSHCGEAGKLIPIVCQPAEIGASVDIPDGIELWGVDSGVRHAVSGSDYTSVRTAAFMGYRIIADLAGLAVRNAMDGKVEIDDPHWNGYLANVSPSEYEKEFRNKIPETINGGEFLARYQGITDRVTSIEPEKTYAVKASTEHAIYENSRVHRFAELITASPTDAALDEAGGLMFLSHESYKTCGLTESRTDRIVELVKNSRDKGLFGARITGGGSGGTVAVMARRGSRNAIDELAEKLSLETGAKPYIFHSSSPGCSSFRHLRIRRDQTARKVAE